MKDDPSHIITTKSLYSLVQPNTHFPVKYIKLINNKVANNAQPSKAIH
jgi:LysM repeat protein